MITRIVDDVHEWTEPLDTRIFAVAGKCTVPLLIGGTWQGSVVLVQIWDVAAGETVADARIERAIRSTDSWAQFVELPLCRYAIRAGVANDYVSPDRIELKLGM